MTALATVADLEARLGHPVDDAARAQALLDDVSAAVRAYTGQLFTRIVTSDRLRMRLGVVRLPQRPVRAIDAVTLEDGTDVNYTWFESEDRLCVVAGDVSCAGTRSVLVTYDHGYDVIPNDVLAVVCNVTNRALGVDPLSGGISQRSITNYQETFGPIGASGVSGLFNSEAALLDRYRRMGTTAWIGAAG